MQANVFQNRGFNQSQPDPPKNIQNIQLPLNHPEQARATQYLTGIQFFIHWNNLYWIMNLYLKPTEGFVTAKVN